MAFNVINRKEIIDNIDKGLYSVNELNSYLAFAIEKNKTDLIDKILSIDYFGIDYNVIDKKHLYFSCYNDNYKVFKLLSKNFDLFKDKADYTISISYTFELLMYICFNNKYEYLKEIINYDTLDFSVNENILIRKSFYHGHYDMVALMLTRNEVRKNEKIYNKYRHVLRTRKLNQLKNKIKIKHP